MVPRIRRAGQRDPVRHYALDHQQAHRARYFLEAGGKSAVVTQPRAAKFLRAQPHPVPGIFLVLANHFDVAGEAEKLHRLEAASVHLLGDGEHRAGSHAKRPEAQLPVAHRGIDKTDFPHGSSLWNKIATLDPTIADTTQLGVKPKQRVQARSVALASDRYHRIPLAVERSAASPHRMRRLGERSMNLFLTGTKGSAQPRRLISRAAAGSASERCGRLAVSRRCLEVSSQRL